MNRGKPLMRKTPLARGKPLMRSELKRNKPPRRLRPRRSPHEMWLEMEILSARIAKAHCKGQRYCQHPLCFENPNSPNYDPLRPRPDWEAHHVVYEQEVRRLGLPKWNTMNVLRLCEACHDRHHHPGAAGDSRVPLIALKDDNYEYAFTAMGERAFNYLRRHYSGFDPRLNRWLNRVKQSATD